MDLLYVGYYADDATYQEIVSHKINNMSQARQNFEANLLSVLFKQERVQGDIVSYIPVSSAVSLPDSTFAYDKEIRYFKIDKSKPQSMFQAMGSFKAYLKNRLKRQKQPLYILMYAINPVFLSPILQLKKKYDIRIVTIASELPEFRRYQNTVKYRLKKKVLSYFNRRVDGYVLFSRHMREFLPSKRPYTVVEGIAPPIYSLPETGKGNIVLYAGGLARDNSILELIEACESLESLDELWICGVGPCAPQVQQAAEKNEKIKYFGQMPHDKILEMERKAKILVNLRNPDEYLTRYSFPSKILEYIASGSMVLSTKLLGIPEEYYDFIETIETPAPQCIAEAIEQLFSMDDTFYVEKCRSAQAFIQEKDAAHQCRKILHFLKTDLKE